MSGERSVRRLEMKRWTEFLFTLSSSLEADSNHCSSSLWRVETSSTEHFLAATLATLSSKRRASSRVREQPPSDNNNFSSLLDQRSTAESVADTFRDLGRRRGVFHPLDEKSVRIKRTVSIVKCSRQKGQTGESRAEVFSTILLQQLAHNTWPKYATDRQRFFFLRILYLPQGIVCGRQWGPYSSAHTSQ